MFGKMKYIIFDDHGKEIPILFPYWLKHNDVASSMKPGIGYGDSKIVSAGFVRKKSDGSLECYHESVSLEVKSRKEDASIISQLM